MCAVFSSLFPSPSSACGETLLSLLPPPAFSPPQSASPQTQGWSSPSSWKREAGNPAFTTGPGEMGLWPRQWSPHSPGCFWNPLI